jgi:hypothetical protein
MLPRMNRYFLSIKRFSSIALALAALSLTAGCGSGDSGEISVETGSLSKAEFIKKADAICEATKNKFSAKYGALLEKHGIGGSKAEEEALIGDIVEQALLPNYEKGIEEISALGAPRSDEEQIASFLNTTQQRLDEIREDPAELSKTPEPFTKAEKIARSYGFEGCAESFV